MSETRQYSDESCIALKHVLEHLDEVKTSNKELLAGQHTLDTSLAKLTANVCEIKRMGERLEKLDDRVRANERTLWKITGVLTLVLPVVTLLLSELVKKL